MNTNIVISLDKRRQKKDGSFPVVMRLGHNERTTSISLDISVKEKDWDSKNRNIKKSFSGLGSVARLNNYIQKQRSNAMDIIFKLNEDDLLSSLTVSELKSRITSTDSVSSFFIYAEDQVKRLIKANRIGTARSYQGVINILKYYNRNKDLQFKDLNYKFLVQFETEHINRGCSYNGLAVYMRTIRAIYNKAIKDEIVDSNLYPFKHYKIRTEPTDKRAIEWEQIKKIIELELSPKHECFNARNYFIASYMMYGMNFSDMAYLRKENILDGRIKYRRRKTSKLYDIKITEGLETILNHYSIQQNETGYIFPIIKRETLIEQDKDIMWARKRYNKKLKSIAELCGIKENLTSYVSRHSFATQAMLQEVPINAISSMLGHSSLKTTEIYLKSLPNNILDDYNQRVVGE